MHPHLLLRDATLPCTRARPAAVRTVKSEDVFLELFCFSVLTVAIESIPPSTIGERSEEAIINLKKKSSEFALIHDTPEKRVESSNCLAFLLRSFIRPRVSKRFPEHSDSLGSRGRPLLRETSLPEIYVRERILRKILGAYLLAPCRGCVTEKTLSRCVPRHRPLAPLVAPPIP
ncbi:hypothetical protein NPIL_547971 [Nephila pilipes]|uniref:Uncharacterized protein n=1 Tax=Nephila pilipes TaxID=299642 RepID=A0A8X6PU50_NEPPI|nr:hypothetical protein NPIL_547971 [Nephila pilipes]